MKAKWTPGPWYYRPEEPLVEAQNDEGFNMTVADCSRSYVIEHEEAKANAILIAAAPKMVEALRKIVEGGNVDCGTFFKVDKADIDFARYILSELGAE